MVRDRRWALVLTALTVACSGGSSNGAPADASADATSVDGSGDGSSRADGGRDGAAPSDAANDAATGPCAPNATLPCACAGAGDVGIQQCLPDGTAWRACACQSYAAQLAVSPTGDDTAAGTLAAPFRTLGRAQSAVRALVDGGAPAGGVVVWLRGGTYELAETFALTAADSGSAASPITWSGYPGESAILVGGKVLPASGFAPVPSSAAVWSRLDPSAQGQVVVAALPALGVTDYGVLKERGFCNGGNQAALELAIDGVSMPLARWPDPAENTLPADGGKDPAAIDHGFAQVTKALSAAQLGFTSARPSRWSQAKDLWVHGMFAYDWADCHEPVTTLDAAGQTMTLGATPGYAITTQGLWYAENLLEEITRPGEWYLDRTTGSLYLWPPSSLAGATIVVSTLAAPLVSFQGTSHVVLRDVTLESGRAQQIDVSQGTGLQVLGVTLRNAGTTAATLSGQGVGVSYAHVYGSGGGGISLAGGDRASLTDGGNYVEDSNIHDFGRWTWMYQPGVSLNDAGQRASHNKIHDSPHAAILYGGNDHVIELNDIYNACQYTADAGAIYAGRDWGARGNVIRNNYLHAITSFLSTDVNAIYLDDCLSGILVQGNIVDGVGSHGILHGGGRDDVMTDNVLARCGGTALSADARCLTWLPQGTPNHTAGDSWDLLGKLEAENYQKPPWSTAFPACAAIPDSWPTIIAPDAGWLLPQGSVFSRNIGYANHAWVGSDAYAVGAYSAMTGNFPDASSVFVNEDAGDLSLTDASVSAVPGLQTVPFGSIGIQP